MTTARRGRASGWPSAPQPGGPPDPDADPEAVARVICLRLLSRRAHSRSELEAALAARRVPADAATAVLDRLQEVQLVDDAAFAEAWVASRQRTRGLARRALGDELRRRGVGPDDVGAALAGVDGDDERVRARELVEKRLPALRGADTATRTRRLVAMLARKGYPPGLAYGVVREVLAEAGAELDDDVTDGAASLDP